MEQMMGMMMPMPMSGMIQTGKYYLAVQTPYK